MGVVGDGTASTYALLPLLPDLPSVTIYNYSYTDSEWGDLLTKYNGVDITYDEIGNPLSYYNGNSYSFTWQGRRLVGATKGSKEMSFSYNDEGFRTSKTVNGVTTNYYYQGSLLIAEERNLSIIVYFYDENGSPFGYQYRAADYEYGEWDFFAYEKNIFGDIVAVYDNSGTKLVSYVYDAWGKCKTTTHATSATAAVNNPYRYKGYYYDFDLGMYYLQTRYYDAEICRFINADSVISGTGETVQGYNLFAYCFNNPINMSDPTGSWPKWIETTAIWLNNNILQPVNDCFFSSKQKNDINSSSHDANRRPYTGEPGSTYTAPNGDSRTYGPDGTPAHDYDHDDHGNPDKHPHDQNGGHNHDWENGVRGPAYSIEWEQVLGVTLVTVCVIGIVVVAMDDATGIGVVDDFLFGPLGVGVGEGLILIFG